MRFLFVLIVFVAMSCGKTEKAEISGEDATEAKDSTPVLPPDWGYRADYYLARERLDTSAFQLIDKTCAILIEETPAQAEAREADEEVEYKERTEREEKERKGWESQPHDSGEYFVSEPDGEYQGDGDFYLTQANDFLKELKIPVTTAKPRQFIRLVASDKKEWTLDIRTNMQPNWTIVLFHVDREPVIIEAMDITKERLTEYFLQK